MSYCLVWPTLFSICFTHFDCNCNKQQLQLQLFQHDILLAKFSESCVKILSANNCRWIICRREVTTTVEVSVCLKVYLKFPFFCLLSGSSLHCVVCVCVCICICNLYHVKLFQPCHQT